MLPYLLLLGFIRDHCWYAVISLAFFFTILIWNKNKSFFTGLSNSSCTWSLYRLVCNLNMHKIDQERKVSVVSTCIYLVSYSYKHSILSLVLYLPSKVLVPHINGGRFVVLNTHILLDNSCRTLLGWSKEKNKLVQQVESNASIFIKKLT